MSDLLKRVLAGPYPVPSQINGGVMSENQNTQSQLEQIAAEGGETEEQQAERWAQQRFDSTMAIWRWADFDPDTKAYQASRMLPFVRLERAARADLDYLTRALSSLLTEAGESPHPNPAELVTQVGTVMRRARRPITSPAPLTEQTEWETLGVNLRAAANCMNGHPCDIEEQDEAIERAVEAYEAIAARISGPLTEEEARRIAKQILSVERGTWEDMITRGLMKENLSRGEIPSEVRPSGICACGHGMNMHLDEKGACRAGWATDARGCMCDGYSPKPSAPEVRQSATSWWHPFTPGMAHETLCSFCGKTAGEHSAPIDILTPSEEAEIIASAPGTIAPGQRPISDPLALDPEDGTLCASCRAPRNEIHSPMCVRRAGVDPGRVPPIDPDSGTRETWTPRIGERVWTAERLANYHVPERCTDASGAVQSQLHTGPWMVRHDNGTEAPYFRDELRPEPASVESESVPKWPEQATSPEKSSDEWPSWAQGEGAIAPPLPEMAVTTGTDNDDNA